MRRSGVTAMYSSSAKRSAGGKNRMLKPLTWLASCITPTQYSGARTIAQIHASGFCSRTAIDAA